MWFPRTPFRQPLLCLIVALVGCQPLYRSPREVSPDPATVEPRDPVLAAGHVADLDLTVGTDWLSDFSVATESYLQLLVEQRNLDVEVKVLDQHGRTMASADGPGGIGIDERLAARLPAGHYRLSLSPRPDGPSKGRARLRIEALRPFDEQDLERQRLIRLGHEATHLDSGSSEHDWRRAHELSLEELAGWRQAGDVGGVVRTLSRLTSLEREFGELDESIRHGEEAVLLSAAAGLDRAEANSRYWLAQSLNRAGRSAEAAEQFRLGLAAAEAARDLVLQGRIVLWQGILSQNRNDLVQARELYERALALRREARDTLGIKSAVNNLAVIEQKLGNFPLAIELYTEAIEEARQLEDPGAVILLESNLSTLLESRGQWQEALDSLSAGLDFARAHRDVRNEASLGLKLAHLLQKLGEPEPARRLLLRSLELEEGRQEGSSQAVVLNTLANLELRLGNLPQAEAWMQRALELSTRLELPAAKGQALRGLAALRQEQNQPELALEILQRVIANAQLSNQPIRLAEAYESLAETYLSLGNPGEALRQLELARETLAGLPVPESLFNISYLVARAHHAEGSLSAAVAEVEGALEMLEQLRLSVDDPDLRATFLARSREAYHFAVGRLLELDRILPGQGHDRRAFATLERARARSLIEMLSRARFGAERALDPALLEAERSARAAVTAARQQLQRAAVAGQRQDFSRLQAELDGARNQLTSAEEALRRAEPRYASLRYTDNYAVEELQASLPPRVALVEYSLQPGRSVAFVVTRERFEVVELAAEDIIASHAQSFRGTLTTPNRRAYETLLSRARQLGDLVVAPLEEALQGTQRIIVVPDGALAYIPFEALRIGGKAGGGDVFLIETWATTYSPSAGVLRTLMEEGAIQRGGRGLVAFADPRPPAPELDVIALAQPADTEWPRLPGARREVAAIAESVGAQQTTLYIDAAASEESLKSRPEVAGARWIHLASHARIDRRTPAESAIVLAPAGAEDGYLTVQEIFALELEAELVVLSGCETALGRQIRGEGLIGLTRAFLYAGARGIQVSLWQVSDDTTPALMASFYANLARDMGAPEALRAAKLASLADPRRSHPFYWAPFVFIGG